MIVKSVRKFLNRSANLASCCLLPSFLTPYSSFGQKTYQALGTPKQINSVLNQISVYPKEPLDSILSHATAEVLGEYLLSTQRLLMRSSFQTPPMHSSFEHSWFRLEFGGLLEGLFFNRNEAKPTLEGYKVNFGFVTRRKFARDILLKCAVLDISFTQKLSTKANNASSCFSWEPWASFSIGDALAISFQTKIYPLARFLQKPPDLMGLAAVIVPDTQPARYHSIELNLLTHELHKCFMLGKTINTFLNENVKCLREVSLTWSLMYYIPTYCEKDLKCDSEIRFEKDFQLLSKPAPILLKKSSSEAIGAQNDTSLLVSGFYQTYLGASMQFLDWIQLEVGCHYSALLGSGVSIKFGFRAKTKAAEQALKPFVKFYTPLALVAEQVEASSNCSTQLGQDASVRNGFRARANSAPHSNTASR